MMFHTLGTILALVAIHTGTGIVIYSVSTICTVFARIKVAVVDICTREINGEEFAICNIQNPGFVSGKKRASNIVLESVHFFFKGSHTGTCIVAIIDI